ncbi:uncharacterized protein LOC112203090 [Rosa chinensis]|uniref:uncharacterized protein LOC112203090 n=1 Tax=Rosa chinensis TaxID=74649 RepID=UPI000D09689E|nr:uncharacterized protein LOC112203090 [Rosa chinensis]
MFVAVDSDKEGIRNEYNSNEDVVQDRNPKFNPKIDMKDPHFCKGMKFASVKILRAALRERPIQDGWEVMFLKNDSNRVRAICKAENCDFELFASKMQHESTLQIKTYVGKHNRARVLDNTMVKTPYLVHRFAEHIKLKPNISTAAVRAMVSFQQVYRTKRAALSMLERSMKEQYAKVQDYAKELKKPRFKAGCRPLLGLDGCHLKSAYGGKLLSAVWVDANNTSWVVAYARVEMESKDSWDWFLGLLVKDLEITGEENGFTFISNKQKGLLPTCEDVVPLADHRLGVRHLWTNFNKLFPGKVMKDQLWAVAKSTTMAYYHKEMVLMNQMDSEAHKW